MWLCSGCAISKALPRCFAFPMAVQLVSVSRFQQAVSAVGPTGSDRHMQHSLITGNSCSWGHEMCEHGGKDCEGIGCR